MLPRNRRSRPVMTAKAGNQQRGGAPPAGMDSRFRGNDEED